jgi:tetratricopeptide (TPR) repeat protein
MTKIFLFPPTLRFSRFNKLAQITFGVAIALNLWVSPSLAGDPFRTNQPRKIGDNTEAAFKAVFYKGDYPAAERYLKQAASSEADEPLVYAMKASLAYINGDLMGLDNFSRKTLETGRKLLSKDELRGNIYTAVGHFLEGAVIITREGTIKGAPKALTRLRQVYQHLNRAEAISAQDPELNLIKGYMDLMLSVSLPFANPDEAIERLEKNAAPEYLSNRGIAIAYRDLKQYSQALDYVNRAIKVAADNPELYYLKAQILRGQGTNDNNQQLIQEAIANFDKALTKKSQLPRDLARQIERERNSAVNSLNNAGR